MTERKSLKMDSLEMDSLKMECPAASLADRLAATGPDDSQNFPKFPEISR